MILAGIAPPDAWIPSITRLNFDGAALRDLAPLAGLSGLRHLDLTDTPATDLSPLAPLRRLRVIGKGRNWRSRAGGARRLKTPVGGRAQKSVQRPPTSQSP